MIRASIELPKSLVVTVEEVLCTLDSSPWVIFQNRITLDARLDGYFQKKKDFKDQVSNLKKAIPEALINEDKFKIHDVIECDWINSYKRHFKPWVYNDFHWIPKWLKDEYSLPPESKFVLLDPGMAFGTGNHDTTKFCLQNLIDIKQPENKNLLDLGCGSGIISITASKLGFKEVVGIDNDEDATRISRDNACLNQISKGVEFLNHALQELPLGYKYDVVIANIQADILCQNSTIITALLKSKFTLIISGILLKEKKTVQQIFDNQFGKKGVKAYTNFSEGEEWVAIKFTSEDQPPR